MKLLLLLLLSLLTLTGCASIVSDADWTWTGQVYQMDEDDKRATIGM